MSDALVRSASPISCIFGQDEEQVVAVREASFELHRGEQVAIVGPSGSGKSTILHLIAALVDPTSGSLEWPLLGDRATLRPGHIGFAFQGPSLLAPLTVIENAAFPLVLAGETEHDAEEAARPLLEELGLGDVVAKLPEELSGGQAQRVGVARALVAKPDLVLADEPTGQLDTAFAQQTIDVMLRTIEETGAGLILATHDQNVANRLAGRWTIDAGVLEETREPA
jgi:predicted ABC-type transport system involved in lysophospholipase L1 biosynthesis ATPase subunit